MSKAERQMDDDELKACPNCDSSAVHTNSVGGFASPNRDAKRFRCSQCYELFDKPKIRKRHQKSGIRSDTLASDLDNADPEEVFGGDD